MADSINDPIAREAMVAYSVSAIAAVVSCGVGQPAVVDVTDIIVRPAAHR